jgi:hypothetical protein
MSSNARSPRMHIVQTRVLHHMAGPPGHLGVRLDDENVHIMPKHAPPTRTLGLTRCKREIEVVGMRGALAAILVCGVVRGGQETGPSEKQGEDQSLLY